VIGSSGTIGSAFVELLTNNPNCSRVVGVHRHSAAPIDYENPSSIEACAAAIQSEGPFGLIINTVGVLHSQEWMPEKNWMT